MSKKRKFIYWIVGLGLLGLIGFFTLTSPWLWSMTHSQRDVADAEPADIENGKNLFVASDCTTCHATPKQEDPLHLGGGRALDTNFGRFYMPNISPDKKDGIGNWTLAEFTKAMREGVAPGGVDGVNLYPAFPYTSYQRMSANDIRDLFAYIQTLPAVEGKAPDHELKFPFNMRRGVGVWRLFFLDGKPVQPVENASAEFSRGQYLVEGPAHCAECHSPRDFMGVIKSGMAYGGGSSPDGLAHFPNISQDETGIGFWPKSAIVTYLKTGVSPIGKVAGGDMAEVIENTKKLSDEDLQAMALYLKSIPGVNNPAPGQPQPNYKNEVIMLPSKQSQAVNLPSSPASDLEKAETVYVSSTKPLFINQDAQGEADGKLLAAAQLTVLEHQGDKMKVRLDGWQLDGADSMFYAQQGQRIMQAVLDANAVAAVERKQPVVDAQTKQTWYPSSLTMWVDNKDLNVSKDALWEYSASTYRDGCSVCHSLPQTDHYLANQWIGNLNAMKRYTSLTDDQYRMVLAYLQNHSKDVNDNEKSH